MAEDLIRFTCFDGLARITLARPDRHNCLTIGMVEAQRDIARELAGRADLRAVLIDADGPDFGTGVDLQEFAAAPDATAYARRGVALAQETIAAQSSIAAPVITAVQGVAAGGGLALALAGDIVLATPSTRFVAAYSKIGLSPDGGVSWQLARRLGPARALDILLTNRTISADDALVWGLISRVAPAESLRDEAERMATDLATGPAEALVAIKRLAWSALQRDLPEQLAAEEKSFAQLSGRPDQAEGVAAFVQRRVPKFG
jgi:2-(1,2-epoxy-1,2-dihydrophenyl)acetyl-CoA isomerase